MKENRKRAAGAGRPFALNPLTIDCKVRLTAADAARLANYCKRHGTKKALAIRSAVLAMLDADEAAHK